MESLSFDALNSDVYCRSIQVTFGNGRTRRVFSGTLNENQRRVVDLPGYQRNVRRIDFRCRALDRRTARIQIAADIGRYRQAWRDSPDFLSYWANLFDWDDDRSGNVGGREWARLGNERFTGRERESTSTYFTGGDLVALGLQPVDDDANCSSMRVYFGNGRVRNIRLSGRLREDRLRRVDLPGQERDVTRVELVCQPAYESSVTVSLFGLS
jgi:hypothetical protein